MKHFSLFLIFVMTILSIYFPKDSAYGNAERGYNLLPNVSLKMLKADFWISNKEQADKVILTSEEIEKFNQKTRLLLPNIVYDLSEYPLMVDGAQLKAMIQEYKFPSEARYFKGSVLNAAYWNALSAEINLKSISAAPVPTIAAFTLQRSNLRSFPTDDFVTSNPNDYEFDLFQETALEGAQPVIVLHQSLSGRWLFVQSSNYRGWLPATALVFAKERSVWQEYVRRKDFLVVTASSLNIGKNTFGMGAKIALDKEQSTLAKTLLASIPAKSSDGSLYFEIVPVSTNLDISRGYLPYTWANVVKQAFKMLGEPYDWGGRRKWRDCSSYTQDIYRVFGIMLPRNADEQENSAGKTIEFAGGIKSRESALKNLKPGATLHMDGHVMLYLGEHEQKHYAIHSLSGYSTADRTRIEAKSVVVSDLSLRTRSGYTYLELLTVGKNIE